MDLNNNPYLQPLPDPFAHQKAASELQKKEQIENERLCFELFLMTDNGKKLAERLLNQFIIPSHFDPRVANAQAMAMWWDGFKAAIRGLTITNGKKHQQRIQQGEPR